MTGIIQEMCTGEINQLLAPALDETDYWTWAYQKTACLLGDARLGAIITNQDGEKALFTGVGECWGWVFNLPMMLITVVMIRKWERNRVQILPLKYGHCLPSGPISVVSYHLPGMKKSFTDSTYLGERSVLDEVRGWLWVINRALGIIRHSRK